VSPRATMTIRLGDITFDLSDEQVADLRRQLDVEPEAREGLVSAAEVANRLGVSSDYVYDHADELGAIRLGNGPKPRLRFDPARLSALPPEPAVKPEAKPGRRRRQGGQGTRLLEVRGPGPYAGPTKQAPPGGARHADEGLTKGGLGSNG
jgi:hypothetical protein